MPARDAYDPTPGVIAGLQLEEGIADSYDKQRQRMLEQQMRDQLAQLGPEALLGEEAKNYPALGTLMRAGLGPEALKYGEAVIAPERVLRIKQEQQLALARAAGFAPGGPGAAPSGGGEAPAGAAPGGAGPTSGLGYSTTLKLGPTGLFAERTWDPNVVEKNRLDVRAAQLATEKADREKTELTNKEITDIQNRIDTLTALKRKTPTDKVAALQNEINYNMARLAKKQKEAEIESFGVTQPVAAPVAATPSSAVVPTRMVGGVNVGGLPEEAQEKIVSEVAMEGVKESEHERIAANAELVENRKTQKDFNEVIRAVERLEKINMIPTQDKEGFVTDVKSRVLGGPVMGSAPSFSALAREADNVMAGLSFKNIPKGSGQLLNSEGERAMYEKGQISSRNDPRTNYNAGQALRSQAINAREYPLFIERYTAVHKTRQGAEEKWAEYVEANPNYVSDDSTGIAQKNAQRIPVHVWEKGDEASIKYLDSHLKKGKLYPTAQGRQYYGGGGTWYTPDEWAGAKK